MIINDYQRLLTATSEINDYKRNQRLQSIINDYKVLLTATSTINGLKTTKLIKVVSSVIRTTTFTNLGMRVHCDSCSKK